MTTGEHSIVMFYFTSERDVSIGTVKHTYMKLEGLNFLQLYKSIVSDNGKTIQYPTVLSEHSISPLPTRVTRENEKRSKTFNLCTNSTLMRYLKPFNAPLIFFTTF